jgi:ketosteroid isomerase-like protein
VKGDPRAALDAYFSAIAALDPDRISAAFAEDGEIEDPVGSEVCRGRSDIARYWANGLCRGVSSLGITVVCALPAGTSIAAHWRMEAVSRSGTPASAEGIDVLDIGPDGLIRRAEGYWDQAGFRSRLTGG